MAQKYVGRFADTGNGSDRWYREDPHQPTPCVLPRSTTKPARQIPARSILCHEEDEAHCLPGNGLHRKKSDKILPRLRCRYARSPERQFPREPILPDAYIHAGKPHALGSPAPAANPENRDAGRSIRRHATLGLPKGWRDGCRWPPIGLIHPGRLLGNAAQDREKRRQNNRPVRSSRHFAKSVTAFSRLWQRVGISCASTPQNARRMPLISPTSSGTVPTAYFFNR